VEVDMTDPWHSRRPGLWRRLGRRLTRPMQPSTMVATAVIAALLVTIWVQRDRLPVVANAVADPYPTQSRPAGVSATSSAAATSGGAFAGTPAEKYPQGEAGITVPAAAAVDGYTAEEVAAALQQVRAALVAGRLDRRMLVDHDPARLLDMITESERDQIRGWFAGGTHANIATWVASDAQLSGEPPRVSGRMTYRTGSEDGVRYLEVVTNYVWVYAFAGGATGPAIVHDEVRWRFLDKNAVRPAARGMWISGGQSYLSNIDCAGLHTGIVGPPKRPAVGGSTQTDPDQYYDPDHTLSIEDTCH
jgi:hypothetical protein